MHVKHKSLIFVVEKNYPVNNYMFNYMFPSLLLSGWFSLFLSFSLFSWFAEKLEFGVRSEISLGVSDISITVRNGS